MVQEEIIKRKMELIEKHSGFYYIIIETTDFFFWFSHSLFLIIKDSQIITH